MSMSPNSSFTLKGPTNTQLQALADSLGLLRSTRGGVTGAYNIAAATVVKATPGRVAKLVVLTAGSTVGTLNNCITTGAAAAANLVFNIPNTVGVYDLDWFCSTGITVITGTGQVVSLSYT